MDNEDNAKGGMPVRNRVIVHLSPTELEALRHLGAIEVRPPDDQLRYLLVNEAKRRGLTVTQYTERLARGAKQRRRRRRTASGATP